VWFALVRKRKALAGVEIDHSRWPAQAQALAKLVVSDEPMTQKQMAARVGYSDRNVNRYMVDDEFRRYCNQIAEQAMDDFMVDLYKEVRKAVRNGSVRAMELALKRAGKLREVREIQSDVVIEDNRSKSNEEMEREVEALEKTLSDLH